MMRLINGQELLSTVFEPTGVLWVDEGRSCAHDVYKRLKSKFEDAGWWNAKSLEVRYCVEHERWIEVPPDLRHPSLPRTTTRQERERSVTLVKVSSTACGVCGGPLSSSAVWPDPRATTRGHEPPLSRAVFGQEVVVRPEHWACNQRKGTRTDEEMS